MDATDAGTENEETKLKMSGLFVILFPFTYFVPVDSVAKSIWYHCNWIKSRGKELSDTKQQ